MTLPERFAALVRSIIDGCLCLCHDDPPEGHYGVIKCKIKCEELHERVRAGLREIAGKMHAARCICRTPSGNECNRLLWDARCDALRAEILKALK